MFINLCKDKLHITFKYNPQAINAVRTITGRKYNPRSKRWEIPVSHVGETLDKLIPVGFTATWEVKRLLENEKKSLAAVEELKTKPELYNGELPLYDFQKTGANFLLAMPSSLLADAPGLGKTIQTIAALADCKGPILVICPASLKYNWKEEIKKWSEDKVQVITGKPYERKNQWHYAPQVKWNIVNYELLLYDISEINKIFWEAVVCDEATRLSNPFSKTTKKVKSIPITKKIALTGTPVSNSPIDIYSIIDWLSPGYLGSLYQFKDRYCFTEPRFNSILGYKNLEELSSRVERYTLRRTKEEVLKDLPPKTFQNISFDLNSEERKLYNGIKQQLAEEIAKLDVNKSTLNLIPVKMLRLKQATGHPKLIAPDFKGDSSKLEVLKELLKPIIDSGEKAIVFTQFAKLAKLLYSELAEYNPKIIFGEVLDIDRQRAINDFNNNKIFKILISTDAGAYGLNIQSASYVIHFDSPWSISKLTQREDRAHRIGQTKPVTVYNLIAKNSIDEYITKILHRKQKASVSILGDEGRLLESGLSLEDVKNILRI